MQPNSTEQRPVHDLAEYLHQVTGTAVDESLLTRALTHRSYAYEHGGLPHNERLEFLGDAVLGIVVTDTLFRDNPELPEGQLAKLRAAVVNSRALAEAARTIDLGRYLFLGRGEESSGGRDKASILADTTEAVIGTVYLCQDLEHASVFIHHLLDPLIARSAQLGAGLDWKTSLQELTATLSLGVPEYQVTNEGPDHDKTFTAHVHVGDEDFPPGIGRSKKEAEQKAAHAAWDELEQRRLALEAVQPV